MAQPTTCPRCAKRLPPAAKFCRHLLRPVEEVPEQAIARLIERTQAIPLLMVELIRGLKRDGFIRARVDGQLVELDRSEPIRLNKNKRHKIEAVVDRLVIREGIRVRGFRTEIPTLEDVFLKLTGHGIRD